MQRHAIWACFLCLKPLSLTKSSCTCLTGTPDNSSSSFVVKLFLCHHFYNWEMVSLVEQLYSGQWFVLGRGNDQACCEGFHAPKTHAPQSLTVLRSGFEESHYCACYRIPGDSGHKRIFAAESDGSAEGVCNTIHYCRKQGQRMNGCLKERKLAISSGFAKRLFPMNLKQPPMTRQEGRMTSKMLHRLQTHSFLRQSRKLKVIAMVSLRKLCPNWCLFLSNVNSLELECGNILVTSSCATGSCLFLRNMCRVINQ